MSINTKGLLAPQIPHVQRLVDSLYSNGFAIDLSETGTGKSYAAAANRFTFSIAHFAITFCTDFEFQLNG